MDPRHLLVICCMLAVALSPVACGDDGGDEAGEDTAQADTVVGEDTAQETTADTTIDTATTLDGIEEVGIEETGDEVVEGPVITLPEAPMEATVLTDALPTPTEGIAFDGSGTCYLSTTDGKVLAMAPDGSTTVLAELLPVDGIAGCAGMAFGPDGALYVCRYDAGRIERVAMDGDHEVTVFLEVPTPNTILFDDQGTLWLTSSNGEDGVGYVARMAAGATEPEKVIEDVTYANGLAFSPDGGTLYFSSTTPGSVHSAPVAADGTVGAPSVVSDDASLNVADGLLVAPDGTLFIAGFGIGSIFAWTGEELVTVTEGHFGTATLAWGKGEGFSETAIYATNLMFAKILEVELGAE